MTTLQDAALSVASAPKMPPEIAKAVIAVMKKIKQLGVDEKNAHGGYNYVSVDKFFDHVGRLMAEADLFNVVNEVSSVTERKEATDNYGKTKVSNWMTCTYEIFLFHASGAEYGPIRRTVQVAATGPQSYGSAMSFAEKYFLRGLFKIPTGEQDADQDAQLGLPQSCANGGARRDDDGHANAVSTYVKNSKKRIAEFTDLDALKEWWADQDKMMRGLFDSENDAKFQDLRAAYIKHGTALKAKDSAPATNGTTHAQKTNGAHMTGDAIPY